jgi:pimeloyl-ACP methyl ester carboxylesterase
MAFAGTGLDLVPVPRIQVPTLLLWGDMGRRSPPHVPEQLHATISGAELATIPEAGHLGNRGLQTQMAIPDVWPGRLR